MDFEPTVCIWWGYEKRVGGGTGIQVGGNWDGLECWAGKTHGSLQDRKEKIKRI